MKVARVDLSKGLILNSSDLSTPFVIKRLPLWPKPGLGWASHPGYLPYDSSVIGYEAGSEIYHSDASGIVAIKSGNELRVVDLLRGKAASGSLEDGVMLPRAGLYRSRTSHILLDAPNERAINLRPLKVIPGNLEPGLYRIWALTYSRIPTGLFFVWYSTQLVSLGSSGGIEIRLAEKPEDSVVRLYAQRYIGGAPGPTTFLAELTGEAEQYNYISHLQEGPAESIAIPRATQKHAAYYNGRYFYQADRLTLLGKTTEEIITAPPAGQIPTGDTGGHVYDDGRSFYVGTNTVGASPVKIEAGRDWDAAVIVPNVGLFVAVRTATETHIYHAPPPDYIFWSLVYKLNAPFNFTHAAHSPSKVLFIGAGQALVGNLGGRAFMNPSGWRTYTLPTAAPIKQAIWTGTEFAAICDGILLRGGAEGAGWTQVSAPARDEYPQYSTWMDFVYAAGKFFILGSRSQGNGEWTLRTIIYDGANWDIHASPKPHNLDGVVYRRFSVLWTDGSIVGFGLGIKGDWYNDASIPFIKRPIGEQDWFGFFDARRFPDGFIRETIYEPPVRLWGSGDIDSYGKLYKVPSGIGGWWKSGSMIRYMRALPDGTRVFGAPIPVGGVGLAVDTDESAISNGLFPARIRTSNDVLVVTPAYMVRTGDGLGYGFGDRLGFINSNLRARQYRLPPLVTFRGGAAGGGKYAVLTTEYSPATYTTRLLYGPSPDALAEVASYTGPPPPPLGIGHAKTISDKTAVIAGSKVIYYEEGASAFVGDVPDAISVGASGQNLYLFRADGVYLLRPNGPSRIYTDTIAGGFDGPTGKLHVVKVTDGNLEVFELDLASFALTSMGVIADSGEIFIGGGYYGGFPVVVAIGRAYIYDGTTWQAVTPTDIAIRVRALIEGPSGDGGGGGGIGESSVPVMDIDLPENTVVWTEPGYINQTTQYGYHTFIPRTSRRITGMTEHPSGVMVFLDNETYTMTGLFTSLNDTRVALYPQAVGLDEGAKPVRVGSTIFVPWLGRIYAMAGGGVEMISYAVADGSPFVAVAYDHRHGMLVCRKKDGRCYRYDIARGVWFDDIPDAIDIAQTHDGVVYAREYSSITNPEDSGVGLFRLAEENENIDTPYYYKLPQEIWIESVRLAEEPVKRVRAVYLQMKSEGPPNPNIRIYNENEVLVASGTMTPTLTSNEFGVARYHFRFPPVITFAPSRMTITFSGVRFVMANDIEVHYEARQRRI